MNILLTLALLQAVPGDYTDAMRKAAAKFTGKEGVVIHLGDSITYANQYSGWARYGKGKIYILEYTSYDASRLSRLLEVSGAAK